MDKLDAVRTLLSDHNTAVGGNGKPGYIDPDKFIANLSLIGASTEERRKGLSQEDIVKCFGIAGDLQPTIIAKEIAKIFRGKEVEPPKYFSSNRVSSMSISELISAFDPENSENAVGKALAGHAKGQPFIVYEQGRVVDTASTLKLLQEIKIGHNGRDNLEVNGEIKKVYKIGDLPDNFGDENPLYPGRLLRPDGTCDQTQRSWEGVPLEVRQLLRLAVNSGEISINLEKANDALDKALAPDAAKSLRTRYRKAALAYSEAAQLGKLPVLKLPIKPSTGVPFTGGRKVS